MGLILSLLQASQPKFSQNWKFGGYILILEALWRLMRGHFGGFGGFLKTNTLLGFQFIVQNWPIFLLILKTMRDNFLKTMINL